MSDPRLSEQPTAEYTIVVEAQDAAMARNGGIVGRRRRSTLYCHGHVLCFFVSVFRQQRINQLVKLSINWFQGLDKDVFGDEVVFGEWLGAENSHVVLGSSNNDVVDRLGSCHEPKPWLLFYF
jgi:hypothetical protein